MTPFPSVLPVEVIGLGLVKMLKNKETDQIHYFLLVTSGESLISLLAEANFLMQILYIVFHLAWVQERSGEIRQNYPMS